MTKVAFIVGPETSDCKAVKLLLFNLGYTVFKSDNYEELCQTGKQAGMMVLIFGDPKFAYTFCRNFAAIEEFKELRILYLATTGLKNEIVANKLKVEGLHIFSDQELDKLKETVLEFEKRERLNMEFKFTSFEDQGPKKGTK
jgi:hypothetical protein